MTNVSEMVFNKFIKDKKLTIIQGESFHSVNYIDKDNNKVAYKETSSWSNQTIYMINDDLSENINTIDFINNILNL